MLQVEGLRKRFGGVVALDECTFSVAEGQLAGLIGPNGAGKTTVFNLITGLLRPDGGSITVGQVSLHGRSPEAVSALGVARTFQASRVFGELTVLDNLKAGLYRHGRYGLPAALLRTRRYRQVEEELERRARELLELFGVAHHAGDRADHLPYGLQRQVEILRALIAHPRLLLLDEPAAGLNPQETGALFTLILRIQQEWGLTVVLIEHDMKLVMNICNVIHVLHRGRIIASGRPDEVRAHPEVVEAYLGRARAGGQG